MGSLGFRFLLALVQYALAILFGALVGNEVVSRELSDEIQNAWAGKIALALLIATPFAITYAKGLAVSVALRVARLLPPEASAFLFARTVNDTLRKEYPVIGTLLAKTPLTPTETKPDAAEKPPAGLLPVLALTFALFAFTPARAQQVTVSAGPLTYYGFYVVYEFIYVEFFSTPGGGGSFTGPYHGYHVPQIQE